MKILAIETSCDETAVSIVQDGKNILSNCLYSQISKHAQHGGVVPDLASRLHTEHINPMIEKACQDAATNLKNIDAIAVTVGPGLEASLLIGFCAAKSLSKSLSLPLIPVHHLRGHIYAHFLQKPQPKFPFISLLISGGHTALILCKNHEDFSIISSTRDDAAGEAFDKIGRAMGLGYPAGPLIEKLAKNYSGPLISFPRPLLNQGFDFSFSGLKTAVMTYLKKQAKYNKEQIAASVQESIIEVLLVKALKACKTYSCSRLLLAGGVAANQSLVKKFKAECIEEGINCDSIPPILCTDNAAMIAAAAYYQHLSSISLSRESSVNANLKL